MTRIPSRAALLLLAGLASTGRTPVTGARDVRAAAPLPAAGSCLITAGKAVHRSPVSVGEAVTVELTLALRCPDVPAPLDVMLVLDRSGSMGGWPLERAKEAALAFVDSLDLSRARVGVVSFDGDARLDAPLSSVHDWIRSAIRGLVADGGTRIGLALDRAGRALLDEPSAPGTARAVVLLSDGRDGLGEEGVRYQGQRLRAAGIHVATVAFGLQADARLLRDIAASPRDAFLAPRSTDLTAAYLGIAGRLREVRALDLHVTDHVAPDMSVVADSAVPAADLTGQRMQWRFAAVPGGGLSWRYEVRPTVEGLRKVSSWARATWTDRAGRTGEAEFPMAMLHVIAVDPWATPYRTQAPTPAETPATAVATDGTPDPRAASATLDARAATAATPTATRSSDLTRSPSRAASVPASATARPGADSPTPSAAMAAAFLPVVSRSACRRDFREADIVLVLDASTTMLESIRGADTKLQGAVAAARSLARLLEPDRQRLALVTFADEAAVAMPLGGGAGDLDRALAGIEPARGSRIDRGLREAGTVLAASASGTDVRRLVVLFSDGWPVGASEGDVSSAAAALKRKGAVVYAVAIGQGANGELLRGIATGASRFIDALDGPSLAAAYRDIAGTLDCP